MRPNRRLRLHRRSVERQLRAAQPKDPDTTFELKKELAWIKIQQRGNANPNFTNSRTYRGASRW